MHAVFAAVAAVAPTLLPRVQRAVIRTWYSLISKAMLNDGADLTFLNYGYAPIEMSGAHTMLRPEDADDEYGIRLYEHVVGGVDLAGRNVLEVGCGRGGGSSYVARYLQPRTMTGVDFAPRAIAFCRRRHRVDNLDFVEGSAEELPFADASFDAVLNVESSHCYPSFERFLNEVSRVLRPGGALLFADLRPSDQVAKMRELLGQVFDIVEEERITANVFRALELHSARRNAFISAKAPAILRRTARNFAAVEGTFVFEALKRGELHYFRFLLRKPTGH